MKGSLIVAILLLNFSFAEAFQEAKLCYILDGILVIYGIILTFLYCRLRMDPTFATSNNYPQKPPAYGERLYEGLTPHSPDTYETIKVEKKPIV
ncbi:Fc receptor, IgE, high affinity I, gamma polypeptide like [Hypomesus transpacificus]|uniref:Fc receptor, IgE, high affinity I, gamma polypeptide like n=1 Tax=Hypomesus transpacificus TaxID=137520 RepID=UPI001F0883AD|nr:Fc receptor, IgE, high affinity I, gamma polypeptide like [Hypomesus transpacificus]